MPHPTERDLAMRPTIVLVHGAFAESSSWNGVLTHLADAGVEAVAAPNPLRSVAGDAASVSDLVRSIDGPVVLVGHSYGGQVITNVDLDAGDIVGAVYVAAFAPEPGESAAELAARFPGSTLSEALSPVPRADGDTDLFIARGRFHAQFCADVPEGEAALMAVTQRPITAAALEGPCGESALWRSVPTCFVLAEADQNIPIAIQRVMAERAGAVKVVELAGASHAVAVSQPAAVAELVLHNAGLAVGA